MTLQIESLNDPAMSEPWVGDVVEPIQLQQRAGGRHEVALQLTPRHGTGLQECRVRYSLQGPAASPLLVVQGGISANEQVSARVAANGIGWWNNVVGDGCAIDTTKFRVLSIEWLDRASFNGTRAIDSADQADAIAALLTLLGCARVHAIVGASYGAMVALALAERHASRLNRAVVIAGAHRAHPLSTALRNIQREIVRFGCANGDAALGLALARKLAMTTYRGEREFAERCSAPAHFADDRFHFAEEAWFEAAARGFAGRFTPHRFLALSESIDLHCVAPENIGVPLSLIGISTDRVVPLADICELQRRSASSTTLDIVDSRYGHDAFLKEPAMIGPLIAHALEGER